MSMLIVFLAKYLIAVPIIVAAGYAFFTGRRREYLTYTLLVLITGYALGLVASQFYDNPRPFVVQNVVPIVAHSADNGFPSEHTLLAGMLAGAVTPFSPILGALLWLVAALIGVGRVLALVHHWIDIIASLLITAISAFIIWRLRYLYLSPTTTRDSSW